MSFFVCAATLSGRRLAVLALVFLLCGTATAVSTPVDTASHIGALIAGALDPQTKPQSLFDVALDDEQAVAAEMIRLRERLSVMTLEEGTETAGLAAAQATLDRARLAFYSLPKATRDILLQGHQERALAMSAHRDAAVTLPADSETARLLEEELLRLAGIGQAINRAAATLVAEQSALVVRRDEVLGWQRRLREAKQNPLDIDADYDALRQALRTARNDLDSALGSMRSESSIVPGTGGNLLAGLPAEVNISAVIARRHSIEQQALRVRQVEETVRRQRAEQLFAEVTTLNRERLGLLPYLSSGKRARITGFTEAGWEQAAAEARHLRLTLRYRVLSTADFISRARGGAVGAQLWWLFVAGIPWLICVAGFFWLRMRSPRLLRWGDYRLAENDRTEGRPIPGAARKAWMFLEHIHRPLEWLLLLAVLVWLMPIGPSEWMEVQLVTAVAGWIIGGTLVVNAINGLAYIAGASLGAGVRIDAGTLRLKSLRLVGRVVIVIILVLVVTSQLVGEGTIYRWVISSCWVAALPVLLLLVSWWRKTVFERIGFIRKKTALQQWVSDNHVGWKSFPAAMAGAAALFFARGLKVTRGLLDQLGAVRRAHAYIFKREVDRLSQEQGGETKPLTPDMLAAFSPDVPQAEWTPCPYDVQVEQLLTRVEQGRGGLVAVIGVRGQGKSTLLRRLQEKLAGSTLIDCRQTDAKVLAAILAIDGDVAGKDATKQPLQVVLLDDAHLLYKPVLGGLRLFDEIQAHARATGARCLWVMALDAHAWPFLRRARDGQPLFDELKILPPWGEEQIGTLLLSRCLQVGVTVSFEDLLGKLPPGSDDIDKAEALLARRAGYFRMVWNHARGNPGMALEAWRSSLSATEDNKVRVRSLRTPETQVMEKLPDASLFIMRAVIQLAPAKIEDLVEATRLTEAQVRGGLQFGYAQGYLLEQAGGVVIAWPWLRAVVGLLERRHLVVDP